MNIDGTLNDDTLDGGLGNGDDTLQGGQGNDTYRLFDAGDVIIEQYQAGVDLVLSALTSYVLPDNVENGQIMLTTAADLTGNAQRNLLLAGDGDNVIDGLGGKDTVSYRLASAGVTVDLKLSSAQATGGSGSDTLLNIENLRGSAFADVLTGNALANRLDGGLGPDTLSGGGGADVLLGGAGNDVLLGGAGNDLLQGGTGKDVMIGGPGADRFDFTDLGANNGLSRFTSIKTINDFVSGTDELVFAANRFDDGTLAGKYVEDLSTASSLQAMKLAAKAAHDGGAEYYFGVFAGDGYLYADDVGDGWGDVIRLAGVTDLAPEDIHMQGSQIGKAAIDLGAYGKLIAPAVVEGKLYYYWDRSGDGTSRSEGSLNGGADYATHDFLDSLFNQDIDGNINPGGNTTTTYRYATINGFKLALPTANGSLPLPQGMNAVQTGTSVADGATDNPLYDELLAIWDAYNGASTEIGTEQNIMTGVPPGWLKDGYWAADESPAGHVAVQCYSGYVYDGVDFGMGYVALQLL